jgi:D-proline reductase (dithiol) PrdB
LWFNGCTVAKQRSKKITRQRPDVWHSVQALGVEVAMPVDSFKFLPRLIAAFYKMTPRQPELPIPWTPLPRPLSECKFGLITSGGLYHRGLEPPFDIQREKQEPRWGDPTFRIIPGDIQHSDLGVSHLHFNAHDVLADINILLPIQRFQELAAEGAIGGLADRAYSLMGYQGFPPDTSSWQAVSGPPIATMFKDEGVDCVLLTPA